MSADGTLSSMHYLSTGFRLLGTPGLRRFMWMPLLINLMVFGGLGWLFYSAIGQWLDGLTVMDRFGDVWILEALAALVKGLIAVMLFLSMGFLFTLLANLVGAPFNGLLAERVEAHLTGDRAQPAPAVMTLIRSLPRLMGSELAKLAYLIVFMVPLLILQFIPVLNLIAPLLLFGFGAWMFALEYLDYPMGNHGALFRDVRRAAREKRGRAFGFGVAVAIFSTLPIINLFIMPIAVAGATALYVDHWRNSDSGQPV